MLVGYAKADQLAWLTEDQARKAVNFLRGQETILLFCGCCNDHDEKIIKVLEVSFEATSGGDYFVYVIGIDKKGKQEKIGLDLAYVYFKKRKKAVNVGKYLGFDCDVCTRPKSFTSITNDGTLSE